ncbi:MAG: carboxymuconolactone decarboxylase family protein [Deltaproteobacteria bacterium]|nr:carboxymuconolactone decarboxylase family protein [Deltaproteobacteria bacterium]MBT7892581.1 carboxymuconolactone decarboxylase family protein [Deltaproteobacteria bacterium]
MEEKAFCEGVLSKKSKELMALSISIVTKCEPCIEWHVQQAFLSGVTDEEIYETIDVAIEMGGGPTAAYARYTLRALEYHKANPA